MKSCCRFYFHSETHFFLVLKSAVLYSLKSCFSFSVGFVPLAIFLRRLFNVKRRGFENNYDFEGETIVRQRGWYGKKSPYREIYPACVFRCKKSHHYLAMPSNRVAPRTALLLRTEMSKSRALKLRPLFQESLKCHLRPQSIRVGTKWKIWTLSFYWYLVGCCRSIGAVTIILQSQEFSQNIENGWKVGLFLDPRKLVF